ncbi:zeta toxin family protein [soil metagenome]
MNLADTTPRLRMFAGPNGSGKSTIKSALRSEWLGVYINPDEIEAEIKRRGFLDFNTFSITANNSEVFSFLANSALLKIAKLQTESAKLTFRDNQIDFAAVSPNSYYASVLADFLRQKLILEQQSFSFETVMSSFDKLELLEKAQHSGYRNYLYFVATDDPQINISRVKIRVSEGGHNVPSDKIKTRYYRTLNLLWEAIKLTNRAYIFDNSGSKAYLIAEITDAEKLEIKVDSVPNWFEKYVLEKAV